jgi:hypothetical protein
MIQRIQTIYLALAIICMSLLLFFPIFSIEIISADGDLKILADFGKDGVMVQDGLEIAQMPKMPIKFIYISFIALTFLTLIFYKRRKRQLLLCRLNLFFYVIFVLGIYAIYFFGKSFIVENIANQGEGKVELTFFMELGFFFLIPTIAFLYLAIRGIKNDENLVNSLDRIR